jgi:hypothetical protein
MYSVFQGLILLGWVLLKTWQIFSHEKPNPASYSDSITNTPHMQSVNIHGPCCKDGGTQKGYESEKKLTTRRKEANRSPGGNLGINSG